MDKIRWYSMNIDRSAYEAWKQECREIFGKWNIKKARAAVVCLGRAGANFAGRFEDDGLSSAVPTIHVRNHDVPPSKSKYSIESETFGKVAEERLVGILESEGARNVVIVCALARGNGKVAYEMANFLLSRGYSVCVAGYFPFSFEQKGFAETSKESVGELKSAGFNFLLVENDRVYQSVSKDTAMPDAMCLADEPIRELIFSINEEKARKNPADNYETVKSDITLDDEFKLAYEKEIDEIIEALAAASEGFHG